MIAAAHGAEVEWNDLDKWQLISDPSYYNIGIIE